MRRWVTLVLATVLATAVATAWGYWSVGSADGSHGGAAASTVSPGSTPAATAATNDVTVTWPATTLENGEAVEGYRVARYDAATTAAQTILNGCAGTLTTTTCTETDVPDGTWTYAVTPVVGEAWQGPQSAKSAPVVSDGTPPVNDLSLSAITGGATRAGATIYYRGAAAGSLRLTNTLTDALTGPASSTTALSDTTTGWTHAGSTVSTPAGGPYVSGTLSWAAGTTGSPTLSVTGRDVAGNAAVSALSLVDDSTSPTPGTVTYADGFAAGRSATVSFTSGTDAGSGIATRKLQRAAAPLDDTTCGSFGDYVDLGTAEPLAPYIDAGLSTGCYRYRYVVTDQVGNQHVATNGNTVKVGYVGAVAATPGVLSHWRLNESAATLTAYDSFTGTQGGALAGHASDIGGAAWVHQTGTANAIIDAGRIRRNGPSGYTIDYTDATPSSADYSVEADLVVRSNLADDAVGVIGRHNPATNSFYLARWEQADSSWNIVKYTNGTVAWLNFAANQGALTLNEAYRLRLEMVGTSLKLYVNGVLKVSATDGSFTTAGRAGIMDGQNAQTGAKSATTGLHIDNFQVTPAGYPHAVDAKGSHPGEYKHGVSLGVAGALAAGSNTAAQFDGVNDHVQVTPATGFPAGASVRSTELWFKTSSSARQVLFRYGSAGNGQEYGLWIDAGGTAMTAWGFGNGNDKVFTMPSAVNNGSWHHVVLTYDGSVLTLYIDGSALPTQAATRSTTTDMHGFVIGAVIRPGDGNSGGFFQGAIDEVSFYSSVLSAGTVADHHQLGGDSGVDTSGPSGGSVTATGLAGTGGAYATSTTLSLVLDKGTDPHGVAATGAVMRRATAPLTGGTCGTFGSYDELAGGTDPASPMSDTVADQACYRYQYVVQDTLGNSTTYTSGAIKVDSTAPSAPGLTFSAGTNAYWPGSGSTVHYRPTATSGSITATAASTDDASGVASYAFPSLGTGWTSTAVGTGVHTYSWSAPNPAVPGTASVTATSNAGLVSTGAPFTLTADTQAPTAGSVTYPDGGTAGTSVAVDFTTGTDAGSGIGSRLLQRAAATLTGSTCGSYGTFTTIALGTNPAGPVADTVSRGACYQYRYVVADNVGNEHVATSGNVVKVWPTYLASVDGTAGLVNYYRLGEALTSADGMGGAAGVSLQSRAGETGASWTRHGLSDSDAVLTNAGRVRKGGSSTWNAVYHASGVPASADYTVEADVFVASNLAHDQVGVVGRMSTTPNAETYYLARYEQGAQNWALYRRVNGSWDWLGASAHTLTPGATYRLALDMTGSSIRVLVDGAERIAVTDTGISAAGRGGVALGLAGAATTVTDSAGMHVDNFRISPQAADRKGSNHGDYFGGVTLGVSGAIVGESNTAAQFDGVDDFVSINRQISDDFSIEFWFTSTQGIGTGAQWWQGAGLVDGEVAGSFPDFGVSLRADGRVVAGVGGAGDVSIVSTSGGLNDGGWHHVVFTRVRSTGALALYVDGSPAGSATGSTVALTAPATLTFGRLQSGINPFQGALDEVALYNTALPAGSVTAHHAAAGR